MEQQLLGRPHVRPATAARTAAMVVGQKSAAGAGAEADMRSPLATTTDHTTRCPHVHIHTDFLKETFGKSKNKIQIDEFYFLNLRIKQHFQALKINKVIIESFRRNTTNLTKSFLYKLFV